MIRDRIDPEIVEAVERAVRDKAARDAEKIKDQNTTPADEADDRRHP